MTRRNMRRPKASLKKYFYFTLICALLLIFGFNIKESEVWKTKAPAPLQSTSAQQQKHQPEQQPESSKQQHNHQEHANRPHQQEQLILGNTQNEYEYDDDYDDDDATYGGVGVDVGAAENHGKVQSKRMNIESITTRTSHTKTETETTDSELSEQQQQQNRIASNPVVLANRSWFFKNGKTYPKPATSTPAMCKKCKRRKAHLQGAKLFPYQDPHNDRIVNQLMYMPPNYDEIKASGKLKTILLYNGLGPWNIKPGREIFLRSKCPVDTCEITAVRERANTVDMILYKDYYMPSGSRRSNNSKQVTMLYYLECPYHTQNVKVPSAINWTATYRRDSDIVAPYEKWVYYDDRIHQMEQDHNYAANKTKKVAWFVSNCGARNGRLQYAHELAKHIDVDIYGACGNYKCSRTTADKCFELLDRDYKFYLAFENSNCRDYVTEKFFVNALNRNILPIVMGARPEDYEVSAPQRSYIHVDEFASAKELADYLHILDRDDKLYNSYFAWKGTGEFINTYYWCRLCAALHDEESLRKPRWYPDVNEWWRGPGVCTISSWRNFKARKDIISDD